MAAIDRFSLVALPLELLANGGQIGVGTGFFYHSGDQPFLVSNWHVFSGRDPRNGQPLHDKGAVPDTVRMPLHLARLGEWRERYELPLYNDDSASNWIQHPKGQAIDVAAISVLPPDNDVEMYNVVRPEEIKEMAVRVGMDVFVIGFPLGLMKQGLLPVWKRASIASEPDLDADGLPMFLVDTATRKGMSGAPVIAKSVGGYLSDEGNYKLGSGTAVRFLGVYSGRYGGEDELSAQLGRVWRRQVINEIIQSEVPGDYKLTRS